MERSFTPACLRALCVKALSIFLLLWSLTSLVACGAQADGKIHLTLWYWDGVIDDKLLAQVSQHFPNIVLNNVKVDDYKDKLLTAMAGHSGVPDIIAINSDIVSYYPDEDQFIDLNRVGAKEIASDYLPWKWQMGTTPGGRQIAIPIDIGPTALFYRADIFAKAGLPTDPQQVSATFKTWDEYLAAGAKIAAATNNKSYLLDNVGSVYWMDVAASTDQYVSANGKYIGNQPHIKQIWDTSVNAIKMPGVDSKVDDWNAGANNGLFASFVNPVWQKQVLEDAAPDTKGKWRIARAPGGDGNYGGSFLSISQTCQYPREAFQIIEWLQNAENQVFSSNDIQLFPSSIKALNDPSLGQPEAYFGGQNTTPIFAAAAQHVPVFFSGPRDGIAQSAFYGELVNVEAAGKDPTQAWNDAQQAIAHALLL